PAPHARASRGVRTGGRRGQERRRPGGLSLCGIRAAASPRQLRSGSFRDDSSSSPADVLALLPCSPCALRLSVAGRGEASPLLAVDLSASQLEMALARYVRLVHAEVSMEVPVSRGHSLVSSLRLYGHLGVRRSDPYAGRPPGARSRAARGIEPSR